MRARFYGGASGSNGTTIMAIVSTEDPKDTLVSTVQQGMLLGGPDDELEASPVPGMNLHDYKQNISRAINDPDDPAINSSFLQWANNQLREDSKEKKEKKDRDLRDFAMQLSTQQKLRDIDRTIARLEADAAEIRRSVARDKEKIHSNNSKIKEYAESNAAVQPALDFYKKHGYFERDDNDEFKNKEVKKLLEAYIERMAKEGKHVEMPENDAVVAKYVQAQKEWQERQMQAMLSQNNNLSEGIPKKEQAATELEKAAKELKEIRDEILRDNDPKVAAQKIDALWKEVDKHGYKSQSSDAVFDSLKEDGTIENEITKATTNTVDTPPSEDDDAFLGKKIDLSKSFALATNMPQPEDPALQVKNTANAQKLQAG